MSATLVTHRGAVKIHDREELRGLPLPPATASFQPVAHYDLINSLERSLAIRNIRVEREELAIQSGGMLLFGVLDLTLGNDGTQRASIGVRASNNMKFAIQFIAGLRIFVCDNLAFSGETTFLHRKHTSNLRIVDEVDMGVQGYFEQYEGIKKLTAHMREYEMTDTEAERFIFHAFRAKLAPLNLFHDVAKNYFEPPHPEFRDRTMWSMNNAFTEAYKALKPAPKMAYTRQLSKFQGAYMTQGIQGALAAEQAIDVNFDVID
jgi:hypothetical protein